MRGEEQLGPELANVLGIVEEGRATDVQIVRLLGVWEPAEFREDRMLNIFSTYIHTRNTIRNEHHRNRLPLIHPPTLETDCPHTHLYSVQPAPEQYIYQRTQELDWRLRSQKWRRRHRCQRRSQGPMQPTTAPCRQHVGKRDRVEETPQREDAGTKVKRLRPEAWGPTRRGGRREDASKLNA